MSNNIQFEVLKSVATINGTQYPIYTGFLSPVNLKIIAEVPSFDKTKNHHQIAQDIHEPPVDQWQRPEDDKKVEKINIIYSDTQKNNLMANPILIGIAQLNISETSNITIHQKTMNINGEVLPIENLYKVVVTTNGSNKPLWILDGQHRASGLEISSQRNQPIPFVLLYDKDLYTPPFLAEIFTHVTTGATPMEPLHQEWMKYSFSLDKYSNHTNQKSFETLIYLCKTVTFGNITNPFHNRIQFNPYQYISGYYAFKFNIIEFEKLITDNYYGKNGQKDPYDLAKELVYIIKAAEDLDTYKNNGSKLFSDDDPHLILAEAFICGALSYLANNNDTRSLDEWKSFLIEDGRRFNKCNWKMSFVQSKGALSSSNGIPSKTVAKESFDLFFNFPADLNGGLLTDYLQGANAEIVIKSYPSTAAGRISKREIDTHIKETPPGGLIPFNMSEDTKNRSFLRIETNSPNCYITKVYNKKYNPPLVVNDALTAKGLNVSTYDDEFVLTVESISYSGDTLKTSEIKVNK